MKYLSFLLLLGFTLSAFRHNKEIVVDKAEAQKAFELLKDIRANPNNYHEDLDYKKDLDVSQVELVWNDTLARVAENRAYDMANRNYFNHVDPDGYGIGFFITKAGYSLLPEWVATKDAVVFESIWAGYMGAEVMIKDLVRDKNSKRKGHRIHLLGLDEWNANTRDVGIGFVKVPTGSTYEQYGCVIIAKHDW